MSETESIREQSAAADARSHERRHLQAERLAELAPRVGRLEQRHLDRGQERMAVLEGNVPAELAPRLLSLEANVAEADRRTIKDAGARLEALEAGVLPAGLQRFMALEEGRRIQAGTIESHSERLAALELNAAGYEKQLGRLASLDSMHRVFEGYPQGHDAEHRVAGHPEQEREWGQEIPEPSPEELSRVVRVARDVERMLVEFEGRVRDLRALLGVGPE
jgi:hypothetical protein